LIQRLRLKVRMHYNDFMVASILQDRISITGHQVAMKMLYRVLAVLLLLASLCAAGAQPLAAGREQAVICLVPLEHADAEQLAAVLAPFLSSSGKIVPYAPTNTLIIRDRPSVVEMLLKAIKGDPGLAQCQNAERISQDGRSDDNRIERELD
jgi:type II secretory pathway component GspD/PulD (secretin)